MYVSSPLATNLGTYIMPAIQEDKGNHQEQVGELIKQTAASIDDLALKMLFVTVQQNNLEVCIENAVNQFVTHSSAVVSAYLYFRYIFKHTLTVVHFCLHRRNTSTQLTKEELIYKAASWFRHCYLQVCKSNTSAGAVTEIEKNHVRIHFYLSQGRQ